MQNSGNAALRLPIPANRDRLGRDEFDNAGLLYYRRHRVGASALSQEISLSIEREIRHIETIKNTQRIETTEKASVDDYVIIVVSASVFFFSFISFGLGLGASLQYPASYLTLGLVSFGIFIGRVAEIKSRSKGR
jgi:hypothetical protein